MLRTQSPVLIAPKEDKLIFKQTNQTAAQLTSKKLVWSGEPTLFLVGLQDNKRIINGLQQHPKASATSIPSILVPISSGCAPPPPPPLPPLSPMIQISQAVLPNHIKVDIMKPSLQPPQYEEATRQLDKTKKNVGKNNVKSQVMTDVLEILIKHGELPETAVFDPTTPTPPNNLPPGPPQKMTFQQSKFPMSHAMPTKLLLTAAQAAQNVEMLSPVHPDCSDSSVNSFDLFLEQQEKQVSEQLQQDEQQQQQQQSYIQQQNDLLEFQQHQQQLLQQQQGLDKLDSQTSSGNVDLKPFDDLEFMELMGHQLDMDMGDETCHPFQNNIQMNKPNLCSTIGADVGNSKTGRRDMNPSLQPSLNDIILQQQQINGLGFNNNYNTGNINNTTNTNNNMNFNSTPMDIEDFENSLSSFDFSSITGVHDDQINTPPHPFSQLQDHPVFHQQHQQSNQLLQSTGIDSSHSYDPPLAINHDILDIFNIDDFKMSTDTLSWGDNLSWGEV